MITEIRGTPYNVPALNNCYLRDRLFRSEFVTWSIAKEPMSLYPVPQNSLQVPARAPAGGSAGIDVPDFSGGPGPKATDVSPWGGV